jgi:hypothetical protein
VGSLGWNRCPVEPYREACRSSRTTPAAELYLVAGFPAETGQ